MLAPIRSTWVTQQTMSPFSVALFGISTGLPCHPTWGKPLLLPLYLFLGNIEDCSRCYCNDGGICQNQPLWFELKSIPWSKSSLDLALCNCASLRLFWRTSSASCCLELAISGVDIFVGSIKSESISASESESESESGLIQISSTLASSLGLVCT